MQDEKAEQEGRKEEASRNNRKAGEDAQGVKEKEVYMFGQSCPLFLLDRGVCGIEIMTFFLVSLMCSFFLFLPLCSSLLGIIVIESLQ